MIDSHCHLDREPLISNLNQVLTRAKDVGLEKLLTICTTSSGYNNILDIVSKDPIIYGTFGIHPHETGLDFYYNNSDKDTQLKSFQNHIEAAIELNIPLIIHSRNAENETYDILKKNYQKNLKILMHCFTGSTDFALNLVPLNAYFSASGIITFKKSTELQETFKKIPEDKLLIETDSPFLSPEPNRGKKNEPSFIKFTAQKLANLRNIEVDKLILLTTNNFNTLFSK